MPNDLIQPSGDSAHRHSVVAVDWSGREKAASRYIWLAQAIGENLVRLENGRTRDQIADLLIDSKANNPNMIVGLDFAFSLPAWFVRGLGIATVGDLWRLADGDIGESWLRSGSSPFWGRSTPRPNVDQHFRATELDARDRGFAPKSVFQVGGAGAVGTASIRGMRTLHRLQDSGFAIWPFDTVAVPAVVEIYPRLLTGEVKKSNPQARGEYLRDRYPHLPSAMMETAGSTEDAFDAAVSALVMAQHVDELLSLPDARGPQMQIEGEIWHPADNHQPRPTV